MRKLLVFTFQLLACACLYAQQPPSMTAIDLTQLDFCWESDEYRFVLNSMDPGDLIASDSIIIDLVGVNPLSGGAANEAVLFLGVFSNLSIQDTLVAQAGFWNDFLGVEFAARILRYDAVLQELEFISITDTMNLDDMGLPDDINLTPLSVNCGETFTWAVDGTTNTLFENDTVLSSSFFNTYGCDSVVTQNIYVNQYVPTICVVTDDDGDGYNEVVFEKIQERPLAEYVIYRGQGPNPTPIDTVFTNEISIFEDTAVYNHVSRYTYTIGAMGDLCVAGSSWSEHTTIKLTSSLGSNAGDVNFLWDDYEGIDLNGLDYGIERTRNGNVTTVYSTPTYNGPYDVTIGGHQPGDDYRVVVDPNLNCSPTRSNVVIRSNRSNPDGVGIEHAHSLGFTMSNPSDGLHLQSDRVLDVTVSDINGRLVASHQGVSVVNERYRSGMYIVTLTNGAHVVNKRLVVTQ